MRAERTSTQVLVSGAFCCRDEPHGDSRVKIENPDFIWGAAAIAKVIGRSEKGAFHALESGRVPGAKKVAGRWGLHLPTFTNHFTGAGVTRQPVAA